MRLVTSNRSRTWTVAAATAALALFGILSGPGPAGAAPARCFGQKVDRVITGSNKTVNVGAREVVFVEGNRITVKATAFSRICAGDGSQTIEAGQGWSFTDGGPGNDRISAAKGDSTVFGGPGDDQIETEKGNNIEVQGGPGDDEIRPGKGNNVKVDGDEGNDRIFLFTQTAKGVVDGGLGNDRIEGSQSHDKLIGGPEKNPRNLPDTDLIIGEGGNDSIFDYSGSGNRLIGLEGADELSSLGDAVSELHGGNGSDKLFSNGGRTAAGVTEQLFGEQGNDRLYADRPGSNGPAYLDGGEGDDWMYGTSKADTIIANSGIKKIQGEGGDDLLISTARGAGNFSGGEGRDTISFAAHTPTDRTGPNGGVTVDLGSGNASGASDQNLSGIENVIGSAFDDQIEGAPGVDNDIDGGLGDDFLSGQGGDNLDGGLGENDCSGGSHTNCNENSPGNQRGQTQVDIMEGGIPIVLGSNQADDISVGFNRGAGRFEVAVAGGALPSGLCEKANPAGSQINCPADPNDLNGLLVYGDNGADQIKLENSIPATLTTTVNGGTGNNTIDGGPSKDFISTAVGSAGSTINGNDGLDVLYAQDRVTVNGGDDTDIFRVVDPCLGAELRGNAGTDSVVFAGAPNGVKASLAGGYAEWRNGGCGSDTDIARDIEKLEGTDYNDWLIVGKRNSSQDGRSVLFGRGGIDILDAKNGSVDQITTGAGGRNNTVIADKNDRITWGYGLGDY